MPCCIVGGIDGNGIEGEASVCDTLPCICCICCICCIDIGTCDGSGKADGGGTAPIAPGNGTADGSGTAPGGGGSGAGRTDAPELDMSAAAAPTAGMPAAGSGR